MPKMPIYIFHCKDAESAKAFYKESFSLRPLRLCGEIQLKAQSLFERFSLPSEVNL
jgi:hypothetical protein